MSHCNPAKFGILLPQVSFDQFRRRRNLRMAVSPLESGDPERVGTLPANNREPMAAPLTASPNFINDRRFAGRFALVKRSVMSISLK